MTPQLASVAVLLVLLQVKHVIADFALQGPYILENRYKWGHPGGLLHVAIHAAGSLIALLIVGTSAATLAILLVAEAAVHYHIDWAKDQITRRMGVTSRDRSYWVLMGTDQGLHQLTYVAMALYWAAASAVT